MKENETKEVQEKDKPQENPKEAARKTLDEPKTFTVVAPFKYGKAPKKAGDKIKLDDVKTINNLTPKYIR